MRVPFVFGGRLIKCSSGAHPRLSLSWQQASQPGRFPIFLRCPPAASPLSPQPRPLLDYPVRTLTLPASSGNASSTAASVNTQFAGSVTCRSNDGVRHMQLVYGFTSTACAMLYGHSSVSPIIGVSQSRYSSSSASRISGSGTRSTHGECGTRIWASVGRISCGMRA